MALIKIATGEVTRHVGQRGAFAVAEDVQLPSGAQFKKSYTVWNETEPAPEIGSIVEVMGVLGVKVREYMSQGLPKHAADISINEPQFKVLAPAMPSEPEAVAATLQDMANDMTKEVPF